MGTAISSHLARLEKRIAAKSMHERWFMTFDREDGTYDVSYIITKIGNKWGDVIDEHIPSFKGVTEDELRAYEKKYGCEDRDSVRHIIVDGEDNENNYD